MLGAIWSCGYPKILHSRELRSYQKSPDFDQNIIFDWFHSQAMASTEFRAVTQGSRDDFRGNVFSRHWWELDAAVQVKGTDPTIWVFPKIGVPQNGWFIMEHPIKMDDLGVPLFSETPISDLCFLLGRNRSTHMIWINHDFDGLISPELGWLYEPSTGIYDISFKYTFPDPNMAGKRKMKESIYFLSNCELEGRAIPCCGRWLA